ncbi:MAG: hypothetical protein J6Q35_05355 [Rikenellaceae bacterium]|nr:hypothetical protein [Rikenellaceae bacterium]
MSKKSWVAHNNRVFKKGIDAYVLAIKSGIRDVMQEAARLMHEYISDTAFNQGDGNMPFYSGNLSDSTGLGVYIDGILTSYIPPKRATSTQRSGFNHTNIYNIDGNQYIRDALQDASTEYSKGLWVVLFSTTPYAFMIDENGSKYWDAGFFSQRLVKEQLLPKFKTAFAKEFPNIAQQLSI